MAIHPLRATNAKLTVQGKNFPLVNYHFTPKQTVWNPKYVENKVDFDAEAIYYDEGVFKELFNQPQQAILELEFEKTGFIVNNPNKYIEYDEKDWPLLIKYGWGKMGKVTKKEIISIPNCYMNISQDSMNYIRIMMHGNCSRIYRN